MRRKEFKLQIRCLLKSRYVHIYNQLPVIGHNFLHLKINTRFILAEFKEIIPFFDSRAMHICLVHNEKAMVKALKKVNEQHSDATFDDAKDYSVMLSLD